MPGLIETSSSVLLKWGCFWFLEAKEAVEAIEAIDVIRFVEVIEATDVFRTTQILKINDKVTRIALFRCFEKKKLNRLMEF